MTRDVAVGGLLAARVRLQRVAAGGLVGERAAELGLERLHVAIGSGRGGVHPLEPLEHAGILRCLLEPKVKVRDLREPLVADALRLGEIVADEIGVTHGVPPVESSSDLLGP